MESSVTSRISVPGATAWRETGVRLWRCITTESVSVCPSSCIVIATSHEGPCRLFVGAIVTVRTPRSWRWSRNSTWAEYFHAPGRTPGGGVRRSNGRVDGSPCCARTINAAARNCRTSVNPKRDGDRPERETRMFQTSVRAVLTRDQGHGGIHRLCTTAYQHLRDVLGAGCQDELGNYGKAPPRAPAGVNDFVYAWRSYVGNDLATIREGEGDGLSANVTKPEHDRSRVADSNRRPSDRGLESERPALGREPVIAARHEECSGEGD